jgi:UDP-glucose 4-epimerase
MIKTMQHKRILVTGGEGFIGKHLVARLLGLGHKVTVLDIAEFQSEHQNLDHIQDSFLNTETVEQAMSGVDVLYHLAATNLPQNANLEPIMDISDNIVGSAKLFQAAVEKNVERIIFGSSGGTVYGEMKAAPIHEDQPTNPIAAYGVSKLSIENYLKFFGRQSDMKTVSLRVANPYGPMQNIQNAQGAVTTFCHKAVSGQQIEIWGDGLVERDYVFITDVIDAFVACLDADLDGRPINIGSGKGVSLNTILDEIRQVWGAKLDVEYLPGRAFDVPKNYLDINRAARVLDWAPRTALRDGIALTLDHMRSRN